MMEKILFQLDLSAKGSLSEQLASEIVRAIRQGTYRPGERLPTIRGLAKDLKVSESVIRDAYRRLAVAGEIVGRTRLGSVVNAPRGATWRGRVLIVMTDFDFNPQMGVHLAKLRDRLQADGFSVSQAMALKDSAGKRNYRGVELALRQGSDFIVLMYGAEDVECYLSKANVPFCVVGNSTGKHLPEGCVGRIGVSSYEATAALVERCREKDVRKAEIVGTGATDGLARNVGAALQSAGVRTVLTRVTKIYSTERRFDVAFEAGFRMAKSRVARKTALPDLVFVADDFVATGYLHGLVAAGVKVPGDFGFACYSNGGLGLYFTCPVTSLEADNYLCGDVIAARISNYLCNRREFPNDKLELVFHDGETF